MAKFIMIYKGQATDMPQMSSEQQQEVMEGWKAWMGNVGSALADVGSPFGGGISVIDDGSTGDVSPLTGYSIVEAGNLDEAKGLCEGHPFLSEGKGNFSIELYELMAVPF